jgi:hypothetical protein
MFDEQERARFLALWAEIPENEVNDKEVRKHKTKN